jgi:hypothetical protein
MDLHKKLALCVSAASLVCLTVAAPITFLTIDNLLLDIKEKHLRFELNEVSNSVSNLMSVGLPLSALRRTQDLIERARSRDPQIGAIVVFDQTGQIYYSTDLGEIGLPIPDEWQGGKGGGTIRNHDELIAMIPLSNSFGSSAGGVALRFALSNMASQREALWLLIGTLSAVTLAMASGLATIASGRVLAGLRHGLGRVATDMQMIMAGTSPAEIDGTRSGPEWLMGRYRPFASRARQTVAKLEGFSGELTRLDEQT